jgi:LacI family transcriptional regulator
LKTVKCPFVLLDEVPGIKTNIVKVDHRVSMQKIVKYLLDTGHSKIVHFAGPPNSKRSQERIEGFTFAFSESPFALREDMIVPIGSVYSDVFNNTLAYFHSLNIKEYPTAIVCFDDFHALAIISALKELQIRVPQDISVVGNDDIFNTKGDHIPLTTIRIPQYTIGLTAAKILIRSIESIPSLSNMRVEFDTELIIGGSSKNLIGAN